MILNKTTEYALTVLGYMATSGEEIFSAEFLHEKLEIPRRYLRRLLTELSKQGFIQSSKGRKGGFLFAKPLDEINLAIIINAVEGSDLWGNCILGHIRCNCDRPCLMHETWIQARTTMLEVLSNASLLDLKEKNTALILSK